MVNGPAALLEQWIAARAPGPGLHWLRDRLSLTRREGATPSFYMAFSRAPRSVGRNDLALDAEAQRLAEQARPGWQPALWSTDQATRSLLVLSLPSDDANRYVTDIERLFDDGDLGELVALYQCLPLLPHPERWRARAAEGIRTNMKAVFEAIALRNPYPAEQLDEGAWNQLVLKCLFIGSPLHCVHGIDARVNAQLARMLSDYAHERWSAGRPVSPELWRCVGPVADGVLLADLERVLANGTDAERCAVAVSCAKNPGAAPILEAHPELLRRLKAAAPSWEQLVQAKE